MPSGGKSKTARALVTWRYLANRKVKHAVPLNTMWHSGHDPISLCGIIIVVPDHWRGTGSQEEYDTVDRLPECRRCTRLLSPAPPVAVYKAVAEHAQQQVQATATSQTGLLAGVNVHSQPQTQKGSSIADQG